MSGTRVQLDLFFKDMTPQEVNQTWPNLLPLINTVKARASNVTGNEVTVKATYHICRHDIGGSCDPEVEI